jgi:hypothetical protein
MGPMLLLVLGILSAVGLGLYQFGEHHRFDMVPDAKGGIFIIDRKSAAINYCSDKTCTLVGNGALPSQIMGNPAALMAVQGAIMGAPAAPSTAKLGAAPNGMKKNIADSGATKPADAAATTPEEPAAEKEEPAAADDEEPEEEPAAADEAPDGFSFN